MNGRVIRGFLGAFLGTFMAIWPAATFDVAWLLLPGAFVGWSLGYHGDRIGSGLVRGLRQVIRAVPQHIRVAKDATIAVGSSAGGWVSNYSQLPVDGLVVARTYGMRAIRWCSHPMNHADAIRLVTNMVTGAFIIYAWIHIQSFILPKGPISLDGIPVVLIPYMLFLFVPAMMSLVLSLFMPFILVIGGVWHTRTSHTKYYREWERYSRSKLLYPVVVAASFIYSYVWAMTLVMLFLTGVGLMMIAGLTYVLLFVSYYSLSFATKFTWRTIRYNRDYGLVSLAVAIMVGSLTFMSERAELVADPTYRLMVASVAGLLAGTVSVALMYLMSGLFMASKSLRRFAFHPPKFSLFFEPVWNWRKNGRDWAEYLLEGATDVLMKRAPRYLSA